MLVFWQGEFRNINWRNPTKGRRTAKLTVGDESESGVDAEEADEGI